MSTEWFIKSPGDTFMPARDEEGMALLDEGWPDWVNVPDHPGIPGGRRRLIRGVVMECVRPGHAHLARHYILEGPVSCCECTVDNCFQWYRRRDELSGSEGDKPSDSRGDDPPVS